MIRLGTGGSFGYSYIEACKRLNEEGLNAMEVEFTYGVKMKKEDAVALKKVAKENNILLSVHSPYYINLASLEDEKIENSRRRILEASERANDMGAKFVVFHCGFYHKRDPEIVYQIIKKEMIFILEEIKKRGYDLQLCPETTGKESQFGSLIELLRMRKETNCGICIDFSHIYARQKGDIDYDKIMPLIKDIDYIHSHFSGIEYSDKGERRHIITGEDFIKPFLVSLLKYNISITIINESPDQFNDAIMTRDLLKRLRS